MYAFWCEANLPDTVVKMLLLSVCMPLHVMQSYLTQLSRYYPVKVLLWSAENTLLSFPFHCRLVFTPSPLDLLGDPLDG